MKIGIIGAGNIGGPLGRLWAAAGHQVCFGSRHPERLERLAKQVGNDSRVGTIREAAEFGEVALEAIPFAAVPELPAGPLSGKPLLSAANYYPSRDGEIDLEGLTQTEWLAKKLPSARFVKAFNMMRAGVMEQLANGGGTPGLAILLAGDDADAKSIAAQLVKDANFLPVDAGTLAAGRVFQSPDSPLYDVQISAEEARRRLAQI